MSSRDLRFPIGSLANPAESQVYFLRPTRECSLTIFYTMFL
jgi:hypothetical protein